MLDRMGDALLKMKRDVGKKEQDITAGVKKILKNAAPLVGGVTDPVAEVAEPASDDAATDADAMQDANTQPSIMYSGTDIENLKKVLAAYESRKQQEIGAGMAATPGSGVGAAGAGAGQGDGFIDSLIQNIQGGQGAIESGGGAGGGMAASAKSFYLDSIMYMSSGNWAVWINGRKFSHDEQESDDAAADIKIEDISREKVTFSWAVGNVDAISPHWQEKVALMGDKGASDSDITVDPKTQTVYVTLRPNQTFISRAMEIVEGRTGNYDPAPVPAPAGASGVQDIRNIPIGAPEPPESDDQSALPDKDMVAAVGALVGKKGQPVDERAIADGLTDIYTGIGKGMGVVPPEQK
ncbi:MAG: hypothetical protein IT567_01935 [Alphaproteobacteria bacterium]|nr:hypothetical protein [Alphaproteobacteria bacterium]